MWADLHLKKQTAQVRNKWPNLPSKASQWGKRHQHQDMQSHRDNNVLGSPDAHYFISLPGKVFWDWMRHHYFCVCFFTLVCFSQCQCSISLNSTQKHLFVYSLCLVVSDTIVKVWSGISLSRSPRITGLPMLPYFSWDRIAYELNLGVNV